MKVKGRPAGVFPVAGDPTKVMKAMKAAAGDPPKVMKAMKAVKTVAYSGPSLSTVLKEVVSKKIYKDCSSVDAFATRASAKCKSFARSKSCSDVQVRAAGAVGWAKAKEFVRNI